MRKRDRDDLRGQPPDDLPILDPGVVLASPAASDARGRAPHQTCHRTALIVTPTPTRSTPAASITSAIRSPSSPCRISTSRADPARPQRHRGAAGAAPRTPSASPPWEQRLRAAVRTTRSDAGLEAMQFAFESPKTRANAAIRAYARACFPPGRPILAGVLELTRADLSRLHVRSDGDDRLDAGATRSSHARRGVCQDFAHLQIACLRALRLPARYVSGYLLTRPPEGKEKLVGADASHAWLSVWCPAARLGRPRSHQRPAGFRSSTSPSPGAATTATSARSAAPSSAAAPTRSASASMSTR